MRKLISVLLASTALFTLSNGVSPASAATNDNWRNYTITSHDWRIDVQTQKRDCVMARRFKQGTLVMFAYDHDLPGWWMGVSRNDWSDYVEKGKLYTLTLVTDDGERYTGKFTGADDGGFMSNGTLTYKFLLSIARSNWLDVYHGNQQLRRLQLDGTYEAMMQLGACQDEQGK